MKKENEAKKIKRRRKKIEALRWVAH